MREGVKFLKSGKCAIQDEPDFDNSLLRFLFK